MKWGTKSLFVVLLTSLTALVPLQATAAPEWHNIDGQATGQFDNIQDAITIGSCEKARKLADSALRKNPTNIRANRLMFEALQCGSPCSSATPARLLNLADTVSNLEPDSPEGAGLTVRALLCTYRCADIQTAYNEFLDKGGDDKSVVNAVDKAWSCGNKCNRKDKSNVEVRDDLLHADAQALDLRRALCSRSCEAMTEAYTRVIDMGGTPVGIERELAECEQNTTTLLLPKFDSRISVTLNGVPVQSNESVKFTDEAELTESVSGVQDVATGRMLQRTKRLVAREVNSEMSGKIRITAPLLLTEHQGISFSLNLPNKDGTLTWARGAANLGLFLDYQPDEEVQLAFDSQWGRFEGTVRPADGSPLNGRVHLNRLPAYSVNERLTRLKRNPAKVALSITSPIALGAGVGLAVFGQYALRQANNYDDFAAVTLSSKDYESATTQAKQARFMGATSIASGSALITGALVGLVSSQILKRKKIKEAKLDLEAAFGQPAKLNDIVEWQ